MQGRWRTALVVAGVLAATGCGGSGDGDEAATTTTTTEAATTTTERATTSTTERPTTTTSTLPPLPAPGPEVAASPLALCEYVAQIDERVDVSDLGWVSVAAPEDGSGPVLVVGSTLEGGQATEADIVREHRRIDVALVPILQQVLAVRPDLTRVHVLHTGDSPDISEKNALWLDRAALEAHDGTTADAERVLDAAEVLPDVVVLEPFQQPPPNRLDENGSLKEEPPCTGLGGEAAPPTTAPPPPQVVYEVIGGPTTVAITFVTPDGISQEADVAVPLTRSYDPAGFDGYYSISAQITDPGYTGTISCRITVAGEVRSEVPATGFPSIASCDAS